jgi:spore coat protein U-like protein
MYAMKRFALAVAITIAVAPRVFGAASCSWTTAPANINFGNYTVFGSSLTANSPFAFTCVPPASGQLTLSKGGAGSFSRLLSKAAAPAGTLGYNLYLDAAGAIVFGDGTSGTQYVTFTGQPQNKDYLGQIYGIIPAGLDAPPGTYTDTIQATLSGAWGSDSRFFTVTATILAECNVTTAALTFGNYDSVVANRSTALDNTTLVEVFCTKGAVAFVSLDNGVNAAGATRRLKSATGNFLTYEMYRESGRTTVWNATNTNSGTSTSKLTAINGGFTVFGRIPAGQDIPAGSYSDTVTVTVNY